MGLKDICLSARITGFVMNFPLYDGGASEKARRLIADGRLAAALEEYQRLAATGSAMAKCVLAYLHLRDLPGAPHDVEASKVLATAALSREPGYANFILSYAAHFENDPKRAIHLMAASYRANFVPAASALGLIFAAGYGVAKHPKEAETFFLRAIRSGHIPSTLVLCRFYKRGERGVVKRIFGQLLFPLAWLYLWISARFMIFSIRQFRHFHGNPLLMFNEKALKP
jgi:TPR repeat protein